MGIGARLARWVRVAVVVVVIAATLLAFARSTLAVYRIEREAADLERHLAALRRRNAQLREDLRRLDDPAVIERIAREELGLVKPDEVAIFLVPREAPPPARPAPAAPAPPQGLWERLARWWQGLWTRQGGP